MNCCCPRCSTRNDAAGALAVDGFAWVRCRNCLELYELDRLPARKRDAHDDNAETLLQTPGAELIAAASPPARARAARRSLPTPRSSASSSGRSSPRFVLPAGAVPRPPPLPSPRPPPPSVASKRTPMLPAWSKVPIAIVASIVVTAVAATAVFSVLSPRAGNCAPVVEAEARR